MQMLPLISTLYSLVFSPPAGKVCLFWLGNQYKYFSLVVLFLSPSPSCLPSRPPSLTCFLFVSVLHVYFSVRPMQIFFSFFSLLSRLLLHPLSHSLSCFFSPLYLPASLALFCPAAVIMRLIAAFSLVIEIMREDYLAAFSHLV